MSESTGGPAVPMLAPPAVKAKPGALTQTKKPARTELEDGKKWIIVSALSARMS